MPPRRDPDRVKTAPAPRKTALVSVHDVMPETLPRVEEILGFLRNRAVSDLTLLVVPGRPWSTKQIRLLQSWQDSGIELAGHGWLHRARSILGLRHRVHDLLISRGEAEHLSLPESETEALVRRAHSWFPSVRLRSPALYVPPAWAGGSLAVARRSSMPFSYYETLSGVYDAHTHLHTWMPLTGYMADTPLRTVLLRGLNALSLCLPSPVVRIALHPEDLTLPLRRDLQRHLARFQHFSTYTGFLRGTLPAARSAVWSARLVPPRRYHTTP